MGKFRKKNIENKIFFFDRDGVLIKSKIKNHKPYAYNNIKDLNFCKGIKKILSLTKKMGFINVMITNQPDIAKKKNLKQVIEVNRYIKTVLFLDEIYMCPHEEKDKCMCRKPKIGLITKAKKEWNANLSKSYIVGDRWKDILCGKRAKLTTILIDYSYDEKYIKGNYTYKSIMSLSKKMKHILKSNAK